MLLWKCAVYNSKKTRFNKEQEASRLFSSLEKIAPLVDFLLLLRVLNKIIQGIMK